MKASEFVSQVQAAAALPTRQEAERWSLAVLEALTDLIPTSEAHRQFITQLPGSLKSHLAARPPRTLSMDRSTFVQNVGAALQVRAREAERAVQAVYGVLAGAIAAGELRDFEASIPPDIAAFLRGAR